MSIADLIRQLVISEGTFYRWRKEYGGMSGDQLRRLKELEKEDERLRRPGGLRSDAGQADPDRGRPGKLLSPWRHHQCIDNVRGQLGISEHRACWVLGQHRLARMAVAAVARVRRDNQLELSFDATACEKPEPTGDFALIVGDARAWEAHFSGYIERRR